MCIYRPCRVQRKALKTFLTVWIVRCFVCVFAQSYLVFNLAEHEALTSPTMSNSRRTSILKSSGSSRRKSPYSLRIEIPPKATSSTGGPLPPSYPPQITPRSAPGEIMPKGRAVWAGKGSSNEVALGVRKGMAEHPAIEVPRMSIGGWGDRQRQQSQAGPTSASSSPARSAGPEMSPTSSPSMATPPRPQHFKFPTIINRLIGSPFSPKKDTVVERKPETTTHNDTRTTSVKPQSYQKPSAKQNPGTTKLETLHESDTGDEDESTSEDETDDGSGSYETGSSEDDGDETDDQSDVQRPTGLGRGQNTGKPAVPNIVVTVASQGASPAGSSIRTPTQAQPAPRVLADLAKETTSIGKASGTSVNQQVTKLPVPAATATPKPAPHASNDGSDISSLRSSDLDIDVSEPISRAPANSASTAAQPSMKQTATVVVHPRPTSMVPAALPQQRAGAVAQVEKSKLSRDDDDSLGTLSDMSSFSDEPNLSPPTKQRRVMTGV
ncbi:hypothetical protein M427DRAFT_422112 [Gonapodya prolifera JEL478]|uniref:Uncharacterized protein n=1 Tax=Gonapodya prolifera (strain JEL478) TaxID=1344416 RepID=A0A139A5U8_GONPJ|nr:hypothetical protein M427DRAFT_422112 [Gonapodya prolifera JEL478]|eukprot:KXS11743.1 hypothetical protein M427DRAFT_422112 [Gonapodya prolifera JEL478]